MTQRQRLPNRRACEHIDFAVAGIRYTASIGQYPDGRIAEVFITSNKIGSAADTAARDSAVVASIALQHGVDPNTLRKALYRDARGAANGPLGAALDRIANFDGDAR